MKNAKKLFALLLALVMVASSIVVFAEETAEQATEAANDVMLISAAAKETKVYDVKPVNLGDYIKDQANWGTFADAKYAFKDGKIISENKTRTIIAYKNESFADALVQAKVAFNFKSSNGSTTWGGFILRAKSFEVDAWSGGNGGYLIVVKDDRIELQRFGRGGQRILAVVPNETIKDGVATNISAAAVNAEGGVNVVLFVEDKCVLNVFDTDEYAITEGQYFDIYTAEGTEISAFDGKAIPSVPAMPVVAGEGKTGGKFTASYSMISFGAEAKDEGYTINWLYSKDEAGANLTELDNAAKKEFGSKYKVVGEYEDLKATGAERTVAAEEVGGYYMVALKDAEGKVVFESKPVIINNAHNILAESVALLIDCEYAYIKGEKVQIDPDDYNVMPSIINARTLVPVRFVAESFGAEVGWDNATRKITIKIADKEIVMTLGETKYTVNGAEAELDVPAQVMYERTMVPVRVISEAFGKTVFWDGANSLIIISDKDLGLNSEADKESLAFIFDNIQDRI